ncbi:hypothetical protein [Microbacterium sp. CSI-V]|uniref:hypothetical protein n=1 Tax=Microbacterium sp. CSI-V TaxID=1933777 RepID=UPI0011157D18|nr:hypothetical protein [Microbacterium sp. CSI-V]
MKKFFGTFSKLDWVTFFLCVVLVLLTLVPLLPFAEVTDHWFLVAIIALGAVTLSAIVLSQIESREADKLISDRMDGLHSLVLSVVDHDAVHEVPAPQIRSELDSLLGESNEWYFRGGSARWQREAVLPRLATVTDRPVLYKVQVISPFEKDLCDKYALYRKKSQPGDPRGDSRQIRLELLAFIYATVVWQSRSKITADVTLLHRFSPFRLDGNRESFIITVADTKKNGLRTRQGNWYHSSLLDEFEFEAGYATRLTLPAQAGDSRGSEDVAEFFEELVRLNPDATAHWNHGFVEPDWRDIFELAGTIAEEPA